jgi:hypothetical protein
VRFFPKRVGDLKRIDVETFPPSDLIAGLMQLPMMAAAERDGELVTDFHAQSSRLSEAQMMRVGWLPPADQTSL